MKLTIEITDSDGDFVRSFAAATGWSDRSGVTPEDWMYEKVSEWMTAKAKTGNIILATSVERKALQDAVVAASTAASTINPPVKPPKLP